MTTVAPGKSTDGRLLYPVIAPQAGRFAAWDVPDIVRTKTEEIATADKTIFLIIIDPLEESNRSKLDTRFKGSRFALAIMICRIYDGPGCFLFRKLLSSLG